MRPLPQLALGLVFGAWVWPWLQPAHPASVVAAALLLLLGLASPLALGPAGACIGLALVARVEAGPELRGDVVVRGVVGSAEGAGFLLDLSGDAKVGGAVYVERGPVRVRGSGIVPAPGTRVVVLGDAHPLDLTRLPGEADPAVGAARQAVRSEVRAREIRRIGPEPRAARTDGAVHAGLIAALVRGERAELPEEEAALLRRTGTWHLVSVSGLHVGLVAVLAAAVAWGLLRPLALFGHAGVARWGALVAGVVAACGYAAWAGWPVPARRAVIMVAAAGGARAAARQPDPWDVLAFAAAAVVATDPSAPGSLSFQLSFGAMLGAGLWASRVLRWLPPDSSRLVGWLVTSLGASIGATVGTLPIVAWHFGSVPPFGAFANLWAIPWIGTIGTPLALLGQVLPGAAGTFALALSDTALDIGLRGLALFDGAPLSLSVGAFGAAMLTLAASLPKRPLVAVALASLSLLPPPSEGALRVWVLAVGQGAATLVEWPDGRRWLVDAGPPGVPLGPALVRMGVRRLDEIVLSHAHPDHFGGISSVLEHVDVGGIRATVLPTEIETDVPRIHPDTPAPGMELIRPGPGFHAVSENDRSLVLRLCAARCILLPGDIEAPAEAALDSAALRSDVALLPHHGSNTSSTPGFVAAVDASVAVVPVGFDNRYAHPRPQALSAWRGRRIYRTDTDGTLRITLASDGVLVERVDPPRTWMLR